METSQACTTRNDSGITLLEVLIAVAVSVLAFLALAQTIVTSHALKRNSDERRTSLTAIRVVSEEIRGVSEEAREDVEDWASLVDNAINGGARLGNAFSVRGLDPQAGETHVGRIELVTNETVTDEDLGVELGMPRDLNGDGSADDADVSDDATYLPVIVTLRWNGLTGDQEIRRGFYISAF